MNSFQLGVVAVPVLVAQVLVVVGQGLGEVHAGLVGQRHQHPSTSAISPRSLLASLGYLCSPYRLAMMRASS